MVPAAIQPRPCTDHNCHGQHDPGERIALAASLCDARGVKLTDLQRRILVLLWKSDRPTGAYKLIEALKLEDARPAWGSSLRDAWSEQAFARGAAQVGEMTGPMGRRIWMGQRLQVTPRCSRPRSREDDVQDTPVIHSRDTPRLTGENEIG